MKKLGCCEVFRGCTCPRCFKKFFICRHCDRGHVYCCRQCSIRSRYEKCQVYRRRHRRSLEGREDHRDRERSRRRRLILGKEIVVDQTSDQGVKSARVSALMRMTAEVAVIGSIGEEEARDEEIYCAICGRPGSFVRFEDATRRREGGGVVFHPDA